MNRLSTKVSVGCSLADENGQAGIETSRCRGETR